MTKRRELGRVNQGLSRFYTFSKELNGLVNIGGLIMKALRLLSHLTSVFHVLELRVDDTGMSPDQVDYHKDHELFLCCHGSSHLQSVWC